MRHGDIIGSGNGLSPARCQAITRTNTDLLPIPRTTTHNKLKWNFNKSTYFIKKINEKFVCENVGHFVYPSRLRVLEHVSDWVFLEVLRVHVCAHGGWRDLVISWASCQQFWWLVTWSLGLSHANLLDLNRGRVSADQNSHVGLLLSWVGCLGVTNTPYEVLVLPCVGRLDKNKHSRHKRSSTRIV